MAYDFVVVGAGLFGSSLARALHDKGRKVLVIDKLPHVAGMCHTSTVKGVTVHTYGPHVFHTDSDLIWNWVNRFSGFRPFMVRTKAIRCGKIFTLPINLMTLHQLWGVVTPAEAMERLATERVRIENPKSMEEFALSQWGHEIYEKLVLHYSRKQWGRDPKDLPASILKRLPIRMTFDDNYFTDQYQGLPDRGYTEMFNRILDGIEVRLEVDFFEDRASLESLGNVIYSGRVDQYHDYVYGPLAFRSCKFDTKCLDGDFQGNPVMHWVDREVPWTRVVEHKHFENSGSPSTVVTWELPFESTRESMPLYPVNDQKNTALFEKYSSLPARAIFGGRLGSYRYRDMHHVIGEALALSQRLT
jgi:UDP-galactopyranose mutase